MFEFESIYAHDYKIPKLSEVKCSVPEYQDIKQIKRKPPIYLDGQTLEPWTKNYVPFDLYWDCKPITRTHPARDITSILFSPQKIETKLEKKCQKKISPAICLEGIKDSKIYDIITKYMYSSEWNMYAQEACMETKEPPFQKSSLEKSRDPVSVQIDMYPKLPEIWKEEGKKWDKHQMRAMIDATKTFWNTRDEMLSKLGPNMKNYENLVEHKTKQKIQELLKNNELNQQYKLAPPSYMGFKSKLALGVPLKKVKVVNEHPWLPATEAFTRHF